MYDTRYIAQGFVRPRRVYFEGSGALAQGVGVCYDYTYNTVSAATVADERRGNFVILPDQTCNTAFAGVTAAAYPASTGGQFIEIYEPGSMAYILVDVSVTQADTGYVTCHLAVPTGTTGAFGVAGFPGRGTARILQTNTTGTLTAPVLVQAQLMDGGESGLVETLQAVSAAAAQSMIDGLTLVTGGITIASNSTATLANGTYYGERKGFKLIGALTTSSWVVTVTTGKQLDGSTTLATLTFSGAGNRALLTWMGTEWQVANVVGATQG